MDIDMGNVRDKGQETIGRGSCVSSGAGGMGGRGGTTTLFNVLHEV